MVVAPTIAAVGLSFYSYGFPQVGKCLEIGLVQILVVIIFSLVSVIFLLLFYFWISFVFMKSLLLVKYRFLSWQNNRKLSSCLYFFKMLDSFTQHHNCAPSDTIFNAVPQEDFCFWSSPISNICGKLIILHCIWLLCGYFLFSARKTKSISLAFSGTLQINSVLQ